MLEALEELCKIYVACFGISVVVFVGVIFGAIWYDKSEGCYPDKGYLELIDEWLKHQKNPYPYDGDEVFSGF